MNPAVRADRELVKWLLGFLMARGLIRSVVSIGLAIVLVPVILNLGFGYFDTVERIGEGEDVAPTNMMDAATSGIRPGTTSDRVDQVFAKRGFRELTSETPGERCRGYDVGVAHQVLAVCMREQGGRWKVSSSTLRSD